MREKLTSYDINKLVTYNVDKLVCVRLIVAMIQADGVLMPDELSYLQKLVYELELSTEDEYTIQYDLTHPTPFQELLKQIPVPDSEDVCKLLLDQVWQVAWSDGVLDPKEEAVYHQLERHFKLTIPRTTSATNVVESGMSKEILKLLEKAEELLNDQQMESDKRKIKLRRTVHDLALSIKGAVATVFMLANPSIAYKIVIEQVHVFADSLKNEKLSAYGDANVWAHEELLKACLELEKMIFASSAKRTQPEKNLKPEIQKSSSTPENTQPTLDDFELIPWYHVLQSSVADLSPTGEMFAFTRQWLRQFYSGKTAELAMVQVSTDAMIPTMSPGDGVVVYLQANYRGEGIYLIRSNASIKIRRMQKLVDGTFRIFSDNNRYSEEKTSGEFNGGVVILGQILWVGKLLASV
ncbi:MAG: hypothetical protein HQM11_17075 [SAR324 cluster bacterium]|nr:hypothetical protein [SAR324 cluster bacterium]